VNARAAVASRRADDEVVVAAEILIIRGKEQGRLSLTTSSRAFPSSKLNPINWSALPGLPGDGHRDRRQR